MSATLVERLTALERQLRLVSEFVGCSTSSLDLPRIAHQSLAVEETDEHKHDPSSSKRKGRSASVQRKQEPEVTVGVDGDYDVAVGKAAGKPRSKRQRMATSPDAKQQSAARGRSRTRRGGGRGSAATRGKGGAKSRPKSKPSNASNKSEKSSSSSSSSKKKLQKRSGKKAPGLAALVRDNLKDDDGKSDSDFEPSESENEEEEDAEMSGNSTPPTPAAALPKGLPSEEKKEDEPEEEGDEQEDSEDDEEGTPLEQAMADKAYFPGILPTMDAFKLPSMVLEPKGDFNVSYHTLPVGYPPNAVVSEEFMDFFDSDRDMWHRLPYYQKLYQQIAKVALCGNDTSRNKFCFAVLRLIMSGQAGVVKLEKGDSDIGVDCQVCLKKERPSSFSLEFFKPGRVDPVETLPCGSVCASKLLSIERLFGFLHYMDCHFKGDEAEQNGGEEVHARLAQAHIERCIEQCVEALNASHGFRGNKADAIADMGSESVWSDVATKPKGPTSSAVIPSVTRDVSVPVVV